MNDLIDHIYVINMEKDKNRLEHFVHQVNSQFNYERIEGVDVSSEKYQKMYAEWNEKSNTNEIVYSNFDWKYYLNRYPDLINNGINTKTTAWVHWLTNGKKELRSCTSDNDIVNHGQWGCLQSHINILHDAVKNQYENIVVFEDDVIFRNSWINILNKIDVLFRSNKKLIYLGASQHNWDNIQYENGFYNAKNSTGTFAYVVNKEFYPLMLNLFDRKRKPVDNYLTEIQNQYSDQCVVVFPNDVICKLDESNIGNTYRSTLVSKIFKWT